MICVQLKNLFIALMVCQLLHYATKQINKFFRNVAILIPYLTLYGTIKQVKCEVIVKRTSQDASDARYAAVAFGLHCI